MFHGQISYSLVDDMINNRACEDDSYIVYDKDYANKNYNKLERNESKMNEWYTIDIYCKTKARVQKLLIKEYAEKIKPMFNAMKRKEQMQNLIGG